MQSKYKKAISEHFCFDIYQGHQIFKTQESKMNQHHDIK